MYERMSDRRILPDNVKEKTRKLFLAGYPLDEVAKMVNQECNTDYEQAVYRRMVYRYGWHLERDRLDFNALATINKGNNVPDITQRTDDHVKSYQQLTEKAKDQLFDPEHGLPFVTAGEATRALDIGIRGERQIMGGLISIRLVEDVIAIIDETIKDSDVKKIVGAKLKVLAARYMQESLGQ